MVKVGTLKDFNNANKLLIKGGFKARIVKSPTDLIRKIMVGETVALQIARLGGSNWAFRYNERYFKK